MCFDLKATKNETNKIKTPTEQFAPAGTDAPPQGVPPHNLKSVALNAVSRLQNRLVLLYSFI